MADPTPKKISGFAPGVPAPTDWFAYVDRATTSPTPIDDTGPDGTNRHGEFAALPISDATQAALDGIALTPGPPGPPGADSTVPGPKGDPGDDGLSAYQVAVGAGFVGDVPAWLASLVGPQGPKGDDGDVGPTGPPGADSTVPGPRGDPGDDGPSAYEVAVANGFVGTEAAWLASLVGPQGDPGPQGEPGADSTVPGPAGAAGATGPAGPGIAAGGTTGQVLAKASATDYDTAWTDPATGGGGTPGGAAGAVQFNASGGFGGSTSLHWAAASGSLSIGTDNPAIAGGGTYGAGNLVVYHPTAPRIDFVNDAGFLLVGKVNGTWNGATNPFVFQADGTGDLVFTPALNDPVPGFTVANTGRFGVGTTTPGARLHVANASPAIPAATIQGATSQSAPLLRLADSVGNPALEFDAAGHGLLQPFAWALAVGVPIATGLDKTNWLPVAFACKLVKAQVAAKTAPTGAGLVLDVRRSADGGATWTSLWAATPANRPTLAAGARTATGTAFDTATLAADDLLRVDVAQVGSTIAGQDVTLRLTSLARNL